MVWFLLDNNKSDDSILFVVLAADALVNGGSVDVDDQIINKLIGKVKCVFDKLKSTNGDLFKNTIGAFINDPDYNLTLEVGNCNSTDDACTNANNLNNIVITIENVNQSSLGIATLILHEALHAEMHRYVSRVSIWC